MNAFCAPIAMISDAPRKKPEKAAENTDDFPEIIAFEPKARSGFA